MKQLRIGAITDIRTVTIAIRDLENAIQELQALFENADPASTQVLVQLPDGNFELWDLVSTGGITLTKDTANKRFTLSVP